MFVVNNHELAVNINDFSERNAFDDSTLSEAEEEHVFFNIGDMCETFEESILASFDSLELVVNLNSEDSAGRIGDVTFKARKQRHNDNQSERFLLLIGSGDAFGKSFDNFVFKSHEKLVFNVDVLFGVFDEF